MTSDGFVAFWKSVQNIPNIKSSYIGPVLEQLMGQKRGCSDFGRIFTILIQGYVFFLGGLGFVWWLSKYIAWPSTVFEHALFYATLETERIARVLEIFYLKVLSILFLRIFSMISIMNMWN